MIVSGMWLVDLDFLSETLADLLLLRSFYFFTHLLSRCHVLLLRVY